MRSATQASLPGVALLPTRSRLHAPQARAPTPTGADLPLTRDVRVTPLAPSDGLLAPIADRLALLFHDRTAPLSPPAGEGISPIRPTSSQASESSKGASSKDPSRLFNSSLDGNVRRAIDLHEGEKIDEKALKALVRAAVALNESSARR